MMIFDDAKVTDAVKMTVSFAYVKNFACFSDLSASLKWIK